MTTRSRRRLDGLGRLGRRATLDLYGGHAVAATGHCHPEVVRAIREQAGNAPLLFERRRRCRCASARPEAIAARGAGAAVEGLLRQLGHRGHRERDAPGAGSRRAERRSLLRRRLPRPHRGRDLGRGTREVPGAGKAQRAGPPARAVRGSCGGRGGAGRARSRRSCSSRSRAWRASSRRPRPTSRACATLCDERGVEARSTTRCRPASGGRGTFFSPGCHGVVPDLDAPREGDRQRIPDGSGPRLRGDRGHRQAWMSTARRFGGGPSRLRRRGGDHAGHPGGRPARRTSARDRNCCNRASRSSPAVREVRGEGFLLGVALDRPAQARARGAPRSADSSWEEATCPTVLRLLPPRPDGGGDRPLPRSAARRIL